MGVEQVRIGLLGPLTVHVAGRPVEVRAPRERSLLARLACVPGAPVSADVLIDHLWGDDPPASARSTLQTYVSHLRRLVEPATIERDASGYRLVGVSTDIDDFDREVRAAGDADDPAVRLERLDAALGHWRGGPLADLGDDGDAPARRRELEERRLLALEDRFDAVLATGGHARVVADLERHVAGHPLRERPVASLMLALYRSGRQADALAAQRRLRTDLVEELGLEPGPGIQALERRILDHDPGLLPVVAPVAPTVEPAEPAVVGAAPGGPPVGEPGDPSESPLPLPGRLTAGRADAPLAGRRSEVRALGAMLRRAEAGEPLPVVVVRGEAGIGKTRLAREVALVAAGRGSTVLWGHCPPAGGGALRPWAEALDHLVRHRPRWAAGWEAVLAPVLPSLVRGAADPLVVLRSAADQRYALLEATAAVLEQAASVAPVLLVLDDLQWADVASLALVEHVAARRVPGLLVVVTVRRPDPHPSGPTDDLLLRLHRDGWLDQMDLAGLSASELRVLLDRGSRRSATVEEVDALHAHTDGNPFFANEVIEALGSGAPPAPGPVALPLPPGVQAVLGQRLDQLGAAAEQVLAAGAAFGDEFDLEGCASCADIPVSGALEALERAVTVRLLDEAPVAGRFVFPHALIRAAVVRRVSAARWAILDERVTSLRRERDAAHPELLGRRIAGRLLGEQAVQAEAVATRTHDDRLAQSRAMLTRIAAGTSGIEARPAPDPVAAFPLNSARAGRTMLRLVEAMVRRGELEAARQRSLECVALARRLSDPALLAEAALGVAAAEGLVAGPADPASDELRALLGSALSGLGDEATEPALRARLLAVLASSHLAASDLATAELLSAGAVHAAERSGDPRAAVAAHLVRRRWAYGSESLATRRSSADRAVAAAEHAPEPDLSPPALVALAADQTAAGDLEGRAATEASLAAEVVRTGFGRRDLLLLQAGHRLHVGEREAAVAALDQATEVQAAGGAAWLGADDAVASLLLVLSIDQDTLAGSRQSLEAAVARWPGALVWLAASAEAEHAAGRPDLVRAVLDQVEDRGLSSFDPGPTHHAGLALVATAAARLRHGLARRVEDLLRDRTEQLVVVGEVGVLDPCQRYVGLALGAQGRWEQAWTALSEAAEVAGRTGGVLARWRVLADLDACARRLDRPPPAVPHGAGSPLPASYRSPLDEPT